jgi:hypothetical protein
MELAAHRGLATMNSAETNPKERGLGKPCAGKPPARFDEGEGSVPGDRLAALSTLPKNPHELSQGLIPVRTREEVGRGLKSDGVWLWGLG